MMSKDYGKATEKLLSGLLQNPHPNILNLIAHGVSPSRHMIGKSSHNPLGY